MSSCVCGARPPLVQHDIVRPGPKLIFPSLHHFLQLKTAAMASKSDKDGALTIEKLEAELSKDNRVKLAGVDIDGKTAINMVPGP